ncbi:MAG: NAD(P)-dependent glycerol-3-phosphate dehydrogenase [Chlamydiales bacterium]|nr:NAD(P)-dependent glycerol-3-phosphate dehydrogenase [Chlamydiales bacterium]
MKIAFLGIGTWGYCLSNVLARNGHDLMMWSIEKELVDTLKQGKAHPNLPGAVPLKNMSFTDNLMEAVEGVDLICESVTSNGIRPVFQQLKDNKIPQVPICVTSKGIEKSTGNLLPEIVLDVFGPDYKNKIACLSGPSHAEEVIKDLPTSVSCAAWNEEVRYFVQSAFSSSNFRVYPSQDVNGVAFGGAMKNIIAIACGLGDGLGFGINFKAALMTRGLHEIKKLSKVKGCTPDTLNGLAGLGDLCVTCLSDLSRNYRFGSLLAQGNSASEAKEKIGVVVEGSFCVLAAQELAEKHQVDVPITQMMHKILYQDIPALQAFKELRERIPKEEHL